MSKGLGRLQRQLRDAIYSHGEVVGSTWLVEQVYGARPSRSQEVAAYRALRGLADRVIIYHYGNRSQYDFKGKGAGALWGPPWLSPPPPAKPQGKGLRKKWQDRKREWEDKRNAALDAVVEELKDLQLNLPRAAVGKLYEKYYDETLPARLLKRTQLTENGFEPEMEARILRALGL